MSPAKLTGITGGKSAGSGTQAQSLLNTPSELDTALPAHYDENLLLSALDFRKLGGKRTGPGEMERVDFKVHENYRAWARKIVESGRFKIEGISDIARLGFILALRWLDSLAPEEVERSVMHQLAQMEEVVAWNVRQVNYVKFIDSMSAMIADQLSLPNGRKQVARVIRRLRRHISAMEHSFYRNHFERMFTERFGMYEQRGAMMVEGQEQEGEHGEEGIGGGAVEWADEESVAGLLREVELMMMERTETEEESV